MKIVSNAKVAMMLFVVLPLIDASLICPLKASTFNFTATVTNSADPSIAVGDQWFGVLTTDGTCTACSPSSGALTVSLNIFRTLLNETNTVGYPLLPGFNTSPLTLFFLDIGILSLGQEFSIDDTYTWADSLAVPFGPGFGGTYAITPSSSPTPEPASGGLLATALMIFWHGYRITNRVPR